MQNIIEKKEITCVLWQGNQFFLGFNIQGYVYYNDKNRLTGIKCIQILFDVNILICMCTQGSHEESEKPW